MALASSSSLILSNRKPWSEPSSPSWSHRPRTSPFTVSASPKKLSKTGKFDSKNRRSTPLITKEQQQVEDNETTEIDASVAVDDGFVMPKLPGDEPDFWEGPQWDALGFFVQYMWAFGVVFAVVKGIGSSPARDNDEVAKGVDTSPAGPDLKLSSSSQYPELSCSSQGVDPGPMRSEVAIPSELLKTVNRATEIDPELQIKGPVTRFRARRLQQHLQGVIRRQFELLEFDKTIPSSYVVNILTSYEDDVKT